MKSKGLSRKNRKYFKIFKRVIVMECAVVVLLFAYILSWSNESENRVDEIYAQSFSDDSTKASTELVTEITTTETEVMATVNEIFDTQDAFVDTNSTVKSERTYSRDDVFNYDEIVVRDDYEYPDYMESMIERYPQTVMFYNDYPEKKDRLPATDVGAVKKGEIPLFIQWDERWGYSQFGDSIIGCAGCGPTCMAMVISGLTGDNKITPFAVSQYVEENGYYTYGEGTAWSAMSEAIEHYGIEAEEMSNVRDYVYESLEEGHPIICSVGPGDFTTGGHFIVLAGIKNGKIIVNDPNSVENSRKLWDLDEFQDQISSMWSYKLADVDAESDVDIEAEIETE